MILEASTQTVPAHIVGGPLDGTVINVIPQPDLQLVLTNPETGITATHMLQLLWIIEKGRYELRWDADD